MTKTADQRRRIRNSAIALAVFAAVIYVAFIVWSIKA